MAELTELSTITGMAPKHTQFALVKKKVLHTADSLQYFYVASAFKMTLTIKIDSS